MRDRQWLGTAVLASILLHLVLLGALPGWREWRPLPVPIAARLLPEVASLERAAPLPQTSPTIAQPMPRRRVEPKREVTGAREVFEPSVDSAEHLPASSTTLPAASASASASASVAAATRSAPGLEAIPSTPASHATDAASVAQYRLAIISLAKAFNRYPHLAVENNWQGRAEVRVTVAADGSVSPGLRSASGHEILDRQALDIIGRAASQVALPAVLRGRELTLDIPVVFSLRDAER